MRLIYINSIPHWTDGELTLPIMAGAQTGDEDLDRLLDLFMSGGEAGAALTPEESVLDAWRGREFFDPTTGVYGNLESYTTKPRTYRDEETRKLVTDPGSTNWILRNRAGGTSNVKPNSLLMDTATMRVLGIGGTASNLKIATAKFASQADLERWGLASAGGTDDSRYTRVSADTAADIASRERIAAQQAAAEMEYLREQERLRNEREQELERIRAENEMKRARLGEAGSLARTAAEVQQRARQLVAELTGVDPIRAGIASQGGVQQGTTPAQAFTGQLQGIASASIPTVSENASIPEIDQTIAALQGQQQLPVAPALGFAQGGTIDMMKMGDGSYGMAEKPHMEAQLGTAKRAILVGEGNPDGDEEVVIMDPSGKVEVIPLVTGAATGGQFDFSTIQQSLAPVFKSLGYNTMPQVGTTDKGFRTIPGGLQGARRLEYQPRLIRDAAGGIYFREPTGTLRPLTYEAWEAGKFNPQDVLQLGAEDKLDGRIGSVLTQPPNIVEQPAAKFRQRSSPLVAPVGPGQVLPDPRLLAGIWRYLDLATKNVLLSAYGTAGLGTPEQARATIEDTLRFYTPRGTLTARGAGRLG